MYLTYKIRTQLWWEAWTRVSYMAGGAWAPPIKATPTTHICEARRVHNITQATKATPTTTAMVTMYTNSTEQQEG